MRMATMELKLDAPSITKATAWRVPAEPVAGESDAFKVTGMGEGPAPFIPGDYLKAENGWIKELLSPSPLALVSILPTLDHLDASERYAHAEHFENMDHQSLLLRLESELRDQCVQVRNDGLFLMAVLKDTDQLKAIEAHPLVFGVDIVRMPNGIVQSHPNRIIRGDAEPMTMDWVREYVSSNHDAEDYGRWPQLAMPDTVPLDWLEDQG